MSPFNASPNSGNGDLEINNQNFQNVGEMKSGKVEDTLVPVSQIPKSYDLVQDTETGALAGVIPGGHLEQEKYTETFDKLKELTNGSIDINAFLDRKSFLTQEEINEAGLVLDTLRDKYQEDEEMMGPDPYGDKREDNEKKYMRGLEHDGMMVQAERISKELFDILTTTVDYEVADVNENCDMKHYTQYKWFVNDKGEVDSKEKYLGGVYQYRYRRDGMSKEEEDLEKSVNLFEKKTAAVVRALETVMGLVVSSNEYDEGKEKVRNLRVLYRSLIRSLPNPELVAQSEVLFNLVNKILPQLGKNYTYSSGMQEVSNDYILVRRFEDLDLSSYKYELGQRIDNAKRR